MIVTNVGRDAVDASSVGRATESQGGLRLVSDRRHADDGAAARLGQNFAGLYEVRWRA